MALDPYSRVFRPDMQTDNQLPQWQDMGGEDQGEQIGQATGSFVELLKKRMAGRNPNTIDGQPVASGTMPRLSERQIGARAGGAANAAAGEPPPLLGGLGNKTGGGMQSL